MMKILSIDPGSNTGWCILEKKEKKIILLDFGVIKKPKNSINFIKNLHLQLSQVIKKFSPIASSIEKIFVNKNFKSSLTLSQIRGAIILTLTLHNLKVYEYSSTFIKKTITGNGHANKKEILFMLQYLVSNSQVLNTINDLNISDAISIGISHFNNILNFTNENNW